MSQLQTWLGPGGGVLVRRAAPGRAGRAAVSEEPLVAQNPVHRRLGAEVEALIGEARDDLAWRQVAILGRSGDSNDALALDLGQAVRGGRTGTDPAVLVGFAPPLQRACLDIDRLAGDPKPGARGDG